MITKYKQRSRLSSNVLIMGLVSLLNDIASDMVYPLLPIFLTQTLGAPPTVLGLIEGTAEATASFLHGISGWFSDKMQRRTPFIIAGYALSTVARFFLAFAHTWHFVLGSRVCDRFGKGVRSTARDALIVESSQSDVRGTALGIHRAMDSVGAIIGPLTAVLLYQVFSQPLTHIFFIACVPSILGVILVSLYVRDVPSHALPVQYNAPNETPIFSTKILIRLLMTRPIVQFFFVQIFFALGNISTAFLLLSATSAGFGVVGSVLLYALYNSTYALFSTPAGMLSDRYSPRRVLLGGLALETVTILLFLLLIAPSYLFFLFPLYGICTALTDSVSRAYLAQQAPAKYIGTVFGIHFTIVGIAALTGGLTIGALWQWYGQSAALGFSCSMLAISTLLFCLQKQPAKIPAI